MVLKHLHHVCRGRVKATRHRRSQRNATQRNATFTDTLASFGSTLQARMIASAFLKLRRTVPRLTVSYRRTLPDECLAHGAERCQTQTQRPAPHSLDCSMSKCATPTWRHGEL
jgi:hypothetical protein